MAKIEGTQNIPAPWINGYRGNLTEVMPDGTIRKRYPYRRPEHQEGGYKVSDDQKTQRTRFKEARTKFRERTSGEKARWYDAMPQWHSLLWYYNYFMLSALDGVLGAITEGAVVIKSIQNVFVSFTAGEQEATIPTAVDPSKVIMFIFGAGFDANWASTGTEFDYYAWRVNPVWHGLNSSRFTLDYNSNVHPDLNIIVQVIEYI